MRVEIQGYDECMLATISALSRVPLEKVRKRALETAKANSWSFVSNLPSQKLFWSTVNILKKEFGIPDKLPDTEAQVIIGNDKKRKLPPSREGSLIIIYNGKETGHIVPFSNEYIYGTLGEKPVTLKEYEKKIGSRAKIAGIWY